MWQNYKSTICLSITLVVLSIISLGVGVLDLNLPSLKDLINHSVFSSYVVESNHHEDEFSLSSIELLLISRLPRLMAILMAGMGLAVAGLIMQNLCRNRFVSPTTAATIQSAQLGILIAVMLLPNTTLLERSFFAFAFALLGTWIFISFIQRVQFKEIILVPLIGLMFGNILSGIINFIAFKYELNQAVTSFTVGHFAAVLRGNYEIVYMVLPMILMAVYFARHFNIVGMGRNFALNLGVNYQLILFIGLTLAAVITASVVVVVGAISYVGLIVPNLVAIFKGDNLKNTILDTALSGAILVLICDLIARTIIFPYELPVELIMGVVGTFCFIVLILYQLKERKTKAILASAKQNSCSKCA